MRIARRIVTSLRTIPRSKRRAGRRAQAQSQRRCSCFRLALRAIFRAARLSTGRADGTSHGTRRSIRWPLPGRPYVPAKIGLDARCGKRISVGMATYMREVSAALPRVAPQYDYRLYTKGQNLGIAEQVLLPLEMMRDRIDLAHYMAHYVPAFAGGTFVFTIHDLIHLRFVQFFRAYIGPYYNTVVKRACRKAARIITSDKRTIDDLVHYFDIDPRRIVVVPLAPRARFFTPAPPHRGERPYFLNVGNHRDHKDIATLLKAWAALPQRY